MAYRLRKAEREDLPAIARMQAARWPVEDYLRYETCVAEEAGACVGFLAWRRVAEGEFEVLNMAVEAGSRRRGVGRQLLQDALQKAGPGLWYLEVRASNEAAIALYKSLGFKASRRRKAYYQNPDEDAIEMTIHS